VTLADFVIPDAIPFVDEIFLAVLTAIFGLWRERRPATDSRSGVRPTRPTDSNRSA